MENKEIIKSLEEKFPEAVTEVLHPLGDDIVCINKNHLLNVMGFLKKKPYDFAMLLDLTCVDFLGEDLRFEMVYHLFSLTHNLRLRIKARMGEDDLTIASCSGL